MGVIFEDRHAHARAGLPDAQSLDHLGAGHQGRAEVAVALAAKRGVGFMDVIDRARRGEPGVDCLVDALFGGGLEVRVTGRGFAGVRGVQRGEIARQKVVEPEAPLVAAAGGDHKGCRAQAHRQITAGSQQPAMLVEAAGVAYHGFNGGWVGRVVHWSARRSGGRARRWFLAKKVWSRLEFMSRPRVLYTEDD